MIRFRACLTAAAIAAGLFVAAPATMSVPAGAIPCKSNEYPDPVTGICWNRDDMNNRGTSQGQGGTVMCSPGRLGQCLGAAQNAQTPGANLRTYPPAGPAPRNTWPSTGR